VHLQSPEADMHNDLAVTKFDHLTNPAAPPAQNDDAYSAVILMFHDHDWEVALLTQVLSSEAFYIGAMGSERTNELRCAALAEAGVSAIDIARVQGPIGLIPSMRDANLLALSTLAEIVKTAQDWKPEDCALVILASGLSERFGKADKLMAEFRGKPLVQHAIDAADKLPFAERFAVVPVSSKKRRKLFNYAAYSLAKTCGDGGAVERA